MRLASVLILVLITQATHGSGQSRGAVMPAAPAAPAEEEIRAIEEQRNQAILHGDAAALDRMTSDDYTFITIRGELRTKADILQGFKSGSFHYDSRTISDLKIRTYGNSAVVTGRAIQQGSENGKDYSGDYWFTRVYVKQQGRWITVALQTTLIRP
ncbi:MAG TPA: nuclear transport factor 2 family protein [Longimicrobiales bacterium]